MAHISPLLLTLERYRTPVADTLSLVAADAGLSNVFNPSVLRWRTETIIAFRALPPSGAKPFHAYLMRLKGAEVFLSDLTAVFESYGIHTVADPKLCVLHGEVHLTFNTGYSRGRNALYLSAVTPSVAAPQRCETAMRRPVEKNWGFFTHGAELRALYSLEPLVVLTEGLRSQDPVGSDRVITFERLAAPAGAGDDTGRMRFTIGTQPVSVNDQLFLIGHERRYLGKRRLYLPRAMEVALTDRQSIRVSAVRLSHSYRSLLGSRLRHNANLWSCTYASGLDIEDGKATISYGVNDTNFSVASIPWRELF